jgi:hypothetical protein
MATNPLSRSATLTIRLDADALAAFDSFAVGRGGRSAVLRQMIEQAMREIADRPFIDRPDGVARNRVSLRFSDVKPLPRLTPLGKSTRGDLQAMFVDSSTGIGA